MVTDPKQAMEKLAALSRRYESCGRYVEFLAENAGRYGLWQKYGQQLSDLYLRLKQGPVRMVIAGESSTGKSTLINAFAGEFIVPESAGVCTPVPVWLMRHDKKSTFVNPYQRREEALPAALYAMSPSRLLELQYSAKADESFQNDKQILVYVNSPHLPPHVTFVDTPGLNANDADTAKTYALFDPPSYCTGDESDPPEMVLFLTRHENLMQSEVNALKDLFAKGADRQSCFLVHNDVRARTALFADTFEEVNRQAVAGLRSSLAALEPSEQPAVEEECYSLDLDFLNEDLAMEHVYSLNALLARLQCVDENGGIYPMAEYLPAGVTLEQREELLEQEEKQRSVAEVRDQWQAMGNSGYAPMQALAEGIRQHVLWLAENSTTLEDVLHIAERLGAKILSQCRPPMDVAVQQRLHKLDELLQELDAMGAKDLGDSPGIQKAQETAVKTAKQICALRNQQLELVIQKAMGKRINWALVLGSLTGGLLGGIVALLLDNMIRFIKGDQLWEEFKTLFERYIGPEGFRKIFNEEGIQDPEPLMVIYRELMGTVSKLLNVDLEPFRTQLTKELSLPLQEVQATFQRLQQVEKSYAETVGTRDVRKMLTDSCTIHPEKLADQVIRSMRMRLGQVQSTCSAAEQEALRTLLAQHGPDILVVFTEKKALFQRVVCPVLVERLEKHHVAENATEDAKLKKLVAESADPLRKVAEKLREEIATALARQRSIVRAEQQKDAEALQLELRKQAEKLGVQQVGS